MEDGTQDRVDIAVGADTSGLDQAERETLQFLDRFNQSISQASANAPALGVPVDLDTLGRFRQELRAVQGDVQGTRELFTGFAQGVDTELRQLGVTGPEAARVINLVWTETVRAAEAADRANVPIASLTSGLERIAGLLPQGTRPLELEAGQAIEQTRLLASGLETVQDRLTNIRRIGADLGQQRLLPPAPPPQTAGLLTAGPEATVPTTSADNLRVLASGLQGFRNAAAEAEEADRRLLATMLQEGQAARKAGGDNEAAASALGSIPQATARTVEGFELSAQGSRKLETALFALGTEAAGLPGPFGRLAEGMLLVGAGSLPVLGVAAGAAVIGLAYEVLTAKTRQAREATEQFITTQLRAAQQRDPAGQVLFAFQGGVDEAGKHVQGLTARAEELNQQLAKLRQGEDIPTETGDVLHFVDQKAIDGVLRKLHDVGVASVEVGRNFLEPQLRAQQQATVQAIGDELALTQEGLSRRAALVQAQHQQELTSDQQFFTQRRQLIAQSEAADVASLQQQIKAQEIVPATTPEERTARQATIDHLNAQIRLRHDVAAAAREALEAEQAMANLLLLHEQRLLRIQQAGGGNLVPGAGGVTGGNIPTSATELDPSVFGSRTQGLVEQQNLPIILQGALLRDNVDRAKELANQRERQRQIELEIARGIVEMGQAFEGVLGTAGQLLSRTIDVADSLRSVQRANADLATASNPAETQAAQLEKIGSLFGAITTGIGLLGSLGSLFGDSALEREHNAILQRNNELLAEQNAQRAQELGAGGVDTAARLAAQGTELRQQAIASTPVGTAGGLAAEAQQLARAQALAASDREFQERLRESGLTIQEFAAIVKQQTGLDVLDSRGHLVAGTLEQANAALAEATERITHFSEGLDTTRRELETEDKLGIGGRSPDERVAALQRTRELELQGLNLPDTEESRIRGLDLSTAAGREAFRQFQIGLFNEAKSPGGIPAGELGTFQNADQLLGVIGEAADGLHAFSDATDEAARRLQNVPDIGRLGELEFQARIPIGLPGDGANLPLPPGISTHNAPVSPSTGSQPPSGELPAPGRGPLVQDHDPGGSDTAHRIIRGVAGRNTIQDVYQLLEARLKLPSLREEPFGDSSQLPRGPNLDPRQLPPSGALPQAVAGFDRTTQYVSESVRSLGGGATLADLLAVLRGATGLGVPLNTGGTGTTGALRAATPSSVIHNNYGDTVVQVAGAAPDLATVLRAVEEERQRQLLLMTGREDG